MAEKRVSELLKACLVMALLVCQANASFQSCYESCFLICLITPNTSAFSCSFKCLKDCITQPSHTQTTSFNSTNKLYFCKLGCSSSLCTNLSSVNHPRSEKVERCVDSCSETCTKS